MLSKCGIPKPVSFGLGFANELEQTRQCFFFGERCQTAFGRPDLTDNERGYTCPRQMSCEERCKQVPQQDKVPDEYGPFWGWPGIL